MLNPMMRVRRFAFALFFLLLCGGICQAETVVDAAWLKLLMYQKSGNGYVSVIENEDFFLAADGRINPQAELNVAAQTLGREGDKLKCTFPARFMYLQQRGLVQGSLADCEEYQKFLQDVQPEAVTLLFTNAYMNNPSSLFGHTLFRIDTKRKGTQLLAHGVNFGADTGDESGVLYALKGLWGGYYGAFAVKPYYDVINLYNNIENRDIWEYRLKLTDEELALFVAYVWEIRQAKIRYYFASKNCSYVLLLVLEAVRPSLNLSERFHWYTLPLDTLKAIQKEPHLIAETAYRPSRQSKIKYRLAQMNGVQKQALKKLLRQEKTENNLSNKEQAEVLETAYQYVQYRYVDGELPLKEYRQQSFSLLRERSKTATSQQYFDELKDGENPILAHEASLVSVSVGAERGKVFEELGFRPLYTSLLEDDFGLLKGAEISLFETKLRHLDGKNAVVLEEFKGLGIKSLSENDMLFSPWSYDLNVGVKRLFEAKKGDDVTLADVELGVGKSYALSPQLTAYAFLIPEVFYGGALKENVAAGTGGKVGIYYTQEKIRLIAEARQDFISATGLSGQTYSLQAGYGLGRNVMLYGQYELKESDYHHNEELSLGVKLGF
jgi:hypothetical protein